MENWLPLCGVLLTGDICPIVGDIHTMHTILGAQGVHTVTTDRDLITTSYLLCYTDSAIEKKSIQDY